MSWLDQLQIASFRDVTFQVDSIDVSAGDNVVLREYPFQDLPTVFRMGEAAEEIKISAYVIGPDYIERREELRSVLTGEGVLVHPTAGSIRVFVAGKFTIKENPTAEGGMARFDLTFVRAETRRYPAGTVSTPAAATARAYTAKATAVDAFAAEFDLANQTKTPGWAAERAMARITESVAGVWGQMKSVTAGVSDFSNAVIGNYQALRDGLNTLVRQPRLLADSLRNLFTLPSDLSAAGARDFMAAFEGLFLFIQHLFVGFQNIGSRMQAVVVTQFELGARKQTQVLMYQFIVNRIAVPVEVHFLQIVGNGLYQFIFFFAFFIRNGLFDHALHVFTVRPEFNGLLGIRNPGRSRRFFGARRNRIRRIDIESKIRHQVHMII